MRFVIFFLSDDDSLLDLAMKNVFPALIVGFALRLTTIPNQKLHTAAFCKLLRLVSTFLLPLWNDFQLNLPSFCKLLPNPREVIAALQLVWKSLMVPCTLNLLYYTPVEIAATNKIIVTAIPKYMAKAMNNEKEFLWHHAINLIANLESLQSLYLREHNLISIAPVVRFSEQVCAIDEQFNNLPFAGQVQMIYAILDKKQTHLHAIIRATLERINTIL